MKKLVSILSMFLIVSMVYSQIDENTIFEDYYYNKTQQGFIINLNWERIPCEIQLTHPAALGENLVLTKKADGKSTYKPKDIIGFSVNGDLWLTKPTITIGKRFCRVLYDGNILLYENIDYVRTGDMTMKRESQLKSYKYVEKEGNKWSVWNIFYIDLKRNLFPLIEDNPELITRITNEGPSYSEANIQTYISIYNDWYMEQHSEFKMRKNRATEKVAEERTHPIAGATLDEALSKLTKGKNETLAEKINKHDKVPVYFLQNESNIQSDAFDASGKALAKEKYFKEFSDDQKNDMYDFIIAEMNYMFKTEKFVRADNFPGKKYDFKGEGINIYAKIQVYGRYQVSDLNSKNEYDISYTLNQQMTFMELTEKGKFKKVGKNWDFEKCKKTNATKIYGLPGLTDYIDPNCPVDGLKDKIMTTGAEWIKEQFPTE